jgi:hypothetical protein
LVERVLEFSEGRKRMQEEKVEREGEERRQRRSNERRSKGELYIV